jgi:hypothetical protein
MANHSKRARSRKRRPEARAQSALRAQKLKGDAIAAATVEDRQPPARATRAARIQAAAAQRRAKRLQRRGIAGSAPVSRRFGERPRPAWHPLPLSELLILVGVIGVVIGFGRGISYGAPPLFAGIAAVALGTLEVTLREHRSGYRSHTVLLAALPVVVLHSVIALIVTAFTTLPAIATVGMLALDLVLFLLLFKLLRTRFLTARTRAAGRA